MKFFVALLLRNIFLAISLFFPIQKKIFFVSYSGKKFTCNPYVIYSELIKSKKYACIVVDNNVKGNEAIDKTSFVINKSISYFYHYLTAKILITNDSFPVFLPKLRNQILINTWHGGGAYKKVDPTSKIQALLYNLLYKDTDYFISSNSIFTQVISKALNLNEGKFLNIGMPRNDILFDRSKVSFISNRVRKKLLLNNEIVVLYAPTWRDDGREILENLADKEILEAVKKRFKGQVRFLIRAHYHTKNIQSEGFIDVSSYPDMQELLCAADILITDYSSCMWDFSLMYKPCFIYATDIAKYEQERDFYIPMSEWPFPIATNNKELVNNITNFDEAKYIEKVKQHHKALGSYEDGHATERVCKLIAKICSGED